MKFKKWKNNEVKKPKLIYFKILNLFWQFCNKHYQLCKYLFKMTDILLAVYFITAFICLLSRN